MIYAPNQGNAQFVSRSRRLVRQALKILRNSDHLAHEQRLRDELANRKPAEEAAEDERDRAIRRGQEQP